MKLSKYIPEIKIIPNFKQPKIGDLVEFIDPEDINNSETYKIVSFEDGNWLLKSGDFDDGDEEDIPYISNYNLINHLKNKTVIIKEIKIIPNQKIDTAEKLLYFVNRYKEDIIFNICTILGDNVNIDNIEELERVWIETPCKLYANNIVKIAPTGFVEGLWLSLEPISDNEDDYIIYKSVKIYWM